MKYGLLCMIILVVLCGCASSSVPVAVETELPGLKARISQLHLGMSRKEVEGFERVSPRKVTKYS